MPGPLLIDAVTKGSHDLTQPAQRAWWALEDAWAAAWRDGASFAVRAGILEAAANVLELSSREGRAAIDRQLESIRRANEATRQQLDMLDTVLAPARQREGFLRIDQELREQFCNTLPPSFYDANRCDFVEHGRRCIRLKHEPDAGGHRLDV